MIFAIGAGVGYLAAKAHCRVLAIQFTPTIRNKYVGLFIFIAVIADAFIARRLREWRH